MTTDKIIDVDAARGYAVKNKEGDPWHRQNGSSKARSSPTAIARTDAPVNSTTCRPTVIAGACSAFRSKKGISATFGSTACGRRCWRQLPERSALLKILSGQETEEMATIWWVLGAMCPTKHEPLFKPITFEVDVEARWAHLEIPGFLQMSGEPIRNPVTGAEHRVRIDMPDGFEFRIAEIGSGTTRCSGPIEFDLKNSYGQFAHLHISNKGVLD